MVTWLWFGVLKILGKPWYCSASSIALDMIREPANCEIESRLTTNPVSRVIATTVHGARHTRTEKKTVKGFFFGKIRNGNISG